MSEPIPTHELLPRFRGFLDAAVPLLSRSEASPVAAFRDFIERARPLLLKRLPEQIAALRPKWERLRGWLIDPAHDLLRIAGLTYGEDAYTDLIAWALRPSTHPPTALRRQQAWLARLGISESEMPAEPAEPITRLFTCDGIPDLIFNFLHFVLVVEAKTGTAEHAAPSGKSQTHAYGPAALEALGRDPKTPTITVFLTPHGSDAANPDAVLTTYADFAVALALELSPEELPEEVGHSLRLLVTHFLGCAAPDGIDLVRVIDELSAAESDPDSAARERVLLANLSGVSRLIELLEWEGDDE